MFRYDTTWRVGELLPLIFSSLAQGLKVSTWRSYIFNEPLETFDFRSWKSSFLSKDQWFPI